MDWNNLDNLILNITFVVLLVTMILYWISIAFPSIKIILKINTISLTVALICLSFILGSRWLLNKYFPLSNLFESLLFLTWCLIFINVIIEQKTKSRLIGAINIPVTVFIIAFSNLSLPLEMQKAASLVPALRSNWLIMHVSVMMFSYAALIIGSLLSILFLILTKNQDIRLYGNSMGVVQHNSINTLDHKNVGVSQALPLVTASNPNTDLPIVSNNNQLFSKKRLSLIENIDNLSYRIIGLGFPLLTVGIIAGAVWANEAWGSYWSWDPKETWALITWLVFAAYLHSRLSKSWQGRKPAILASFGFIIIWICYLGVNFLGRGLHSYGWV